MSHDVGKLLTDTVYGLQKDVTKVALLAVASVVYRALKDSVGPDLRSVLLRGGPAGLVLAFIGGFALLRVYTRAPESNQSELQSPVPAAGVRISPLSIGLAFITVFAIDRFDLFVGLERLALRQLRSVSEVAGPAFHRILTLARPQAPPEARVSLRRRLWRWLLPSALLAQLWHVLERARRSRAAAALMEVQRQLELQNPALRLWRVLQGTRARWQPILEFISAFIGLSSALKYLLK